MWAECLLAWFPPPVASVDAKAAALHFAEILQRLEATARAFTKPKG